MIVVVAPSGRLPTLSKMVRVLIFLVTMFLDVVSIHTSIGILARWTLEERKCYILVVLTTPLSIISIGQVTNVTFVETGMQLPKYFGNMNIVVAGLQHITEEQRRLVDLPFLLKQSRLPTHGSDDGVTETESVFSILPCATVVHVYLLH